MSKRSRIISKSRRNSSRSLRMISLRLSKESKISKTLKQSQQMPPLERSNRLQIQIKDKKLLNLRKIRRSNMCLHMNPNAVRGSLIEKRKKVAM